MLFNSLAYAVFLPIVFLIYWLLPHRFRWFVILIASYYFYMSWNAKYAILIFFTTFISYGAALWIASESSAKKKKWILAGTAVLCLGVLFFFKYFNFFSQTISDFLQVFSIKMHPVTLRFLLPVGISFYTFQTLSYVIDVYRGNTAAERHLGIYAAFISFFPQLVAGPIERTNNLLPQIKSHKSFDYTLAMQGARLMLWGFFKKIAVADVISVYVDKAYSHIGICTGFDLLSAILLFSIQIYCDFSGYSDIAIGTAKIFGIRLIDNFNSPYFSCSIREFWSRWHISLSTWFRDYVYIPLGGNRCAKIKAYRNLIITFIVSGIWHGANWTYIFWGALHGLFQVVEKIITPPSQNTSPIKKFASWAAVFVFCNIAWVFFRANSLYNAAYLFYSLLRRLSDLSSFTQTKIGLSSHVWLYITSVCGIVAAYDYASLSHNVIEAISAIKLPLRLIIEYTLLLFIVYAVITSSGNNQFVYFQF